MMRGVYYLVVQHERSPRNGLVETASLHAWSMPVLRLQLALDRHSPWWDISLHITSCNSVAHTLWGFRYSRRLTLQPADPPRSPVKP